VGIDRRINLQKLEVLERVVALGGMTRAADALEVAQPVVTEHIQSLERRMGAKLFEREGRRLVLTEAGRLAHAWSADVLRRTREFERDWQGLTCGLRGSIVIGTSMSIGSYELPVVLAAFAKRYPDVSIRVDIEGAEHAIEATATGRNDISIVMAEAPPPVASLAAERIGSDELVVLAPATGLVDGTDITAGELALLPFVEAQDGSIRRAFADRQLEAMGIPNRRVVMEFGHPEAMKTAVAGGIGVACLFRSAVQREVASGDLRVLNVDGARMTGPVWLVHRRQRSLSAVHRELIDNIRLHFAEPG
jgi:DNA-binding transcriptional LysR family regulator